MSTEKPIWASPMVYHVQWLFQEPSHVIYITPIWRRWLLEHFYGLRFWPIFGFAWNDTKIHLLTIEILNYTCLSVIRHVFTIIMSFYGFFVTFKKLDFWALFWSYWKGMNLISLLMMLKHQEKSSLIFTKWFEAVGVVSRVHNYENLDFSKYRPTFNLFYKKGMSFEMTLGS